MKGIRVVDATGYSCPHHGALAGEQIVLYHRADGYLHRRCRICRDDLMRKYRHRYNERWKGRGEYGQEVRRSRARTKAETIEKYGGRCFCCGEDRPGFLSIDHAKNDGAAHRKEMGGGSEIWNWLRRNNYPQDGRFRLACFNCNLGRAFNGGVCPHESSLKEI